MAEINAGDLLIADPFLKDPNFLRTVIFICEHQPEGSFGLVLNKRFEETVGDVVPQLEGCSFPLYFGGPVQENTLHFLHTIPGKIEGGVEVVDGIFWGGEFKNVETLILTGQLNENEIRFYVGYSGWTEGQLNGEIETKSWIVKPATKRLVFMNDTDNIWPESLKELGGEYKQMVNYPLDPQLN